MNIKNTITISLFCLTSLIATPQKKDVKITSEKITENIYVLQGQGGNIGVFVGKEYVFMIDDQFAPLTKKIISKIKEITDKPIRYLINTHWHGDHTGVMKI